MPVFERNESMTQETVMKVVLDTNVVLDWLHFSDSACLTLARAIQSGKIKPITSGLCLEELRQVIKRPEFGLDLRGQEQFLEKYHEHAHILELEEAFVETLPYCSDPDDQKFIELAWRAGARYLLSRDKAVLKLSKKLWTFGIEALTPAGFSAVFSLPRLDGHLP